ncbi:MAG TPA: transketolase C-terminal domain-containing protein, partial [Micromonosporaceae bacterium]|nr:transketolase C-terminal domain-containing protein [Micromonosporaceae bacterium]
MRERVGENINRALHRLFRDDAGLFLLGEDVLDPYGGAFRITKGLSTGYPDRVLTTPLSENAVVGVGAGLALTGNRVVVEVMFGDFLLLAFDQLVNFAAKSVAMYGRRVPLPLVVRCPVGGNRGYGPTHSQNPQKHLIGVPHLTLYEMSPLHDAYDLLTAALGRAEPAVLFEDKVLYTQWHRGVGTPAQDGFECVALPGPGQWMRVDRAGSPAPDMVLIVTGGVANRALDAVRLLHERAGLTVTLLVPGQLYPFEAEPVLPLVESAGLACVAEEGGRGGSWGTEVAAVLHERAWGRLAAPVALVASADSVIPAAPHLEREVVVQTESIVRGLTALHRSAGGHHPLAAAPPAPTREHVAAPPFHEIVVPVLNPNDDRCMLVDRLVADGDHVTAGTPVATVETSKATADIEADRDGVLRWLRDTGDEVRFGEAIARLGGAVVERGEADARTAGAPRGDGPRPVSRNRAAVAAAVTASHRTIPAAFGAVEVELDRATAFLDRLSDRLDSVVDLPTLIVK